LDQRISDFVTHLLSNPNVKNETPLAAESFLLNFIAQNESKLKTSFSSPQFFPDMHPNDAMTLLVNDLRERTVNSVMPFFKKIIAEIDFMVLQNFQKSTFDNAYFKTKFEEFIKLQLNDKIARINFSPIINIFNTEALNKYIGFSFFKRSPLFFELVRVQRNNLQADQYINYLKIVLLIKNIAFVKMQLPGMTENKVNIMDFIRIPKSLTEYVDKMAVSMNTLLPGVSPEVVKISLYSNIPSSMVSPEYASSRLMYILINRFNNYTEYKTIDRGAESPDKSWFSSARKNSAHYGFDKRILEDLYIMAGDNKW